MAVTKKTGKKAVVKKVSKGVTKKATAKAVCCKGGVGFALR